MKTARSERNIYFISISVHSKCVRQSACVCVCVFWGEMSRYTDACTQAVGKPDPGSWKQCLPLLGSTRMVCS